MLRIKDPKVFLDFYQNVLDKKLLGKYDFPAMQFTPYFVGYQQEIPEEGEKSKTKWLFSRPALIELTHNWGSEKDENFAGYHSGNEDPRGFGHRH